jgi:RimJ/RimL family protein N-acetyltransferase
MRLIEATTQDELSLLKRFTTDGYNESGTDPIPPDGPVMVWLIDTPEGVIGSVGVYGVNWPSRRCRGMIYIVPEYRGNGLASMAHRLLEKKVFEDLNLRRLEGVVRSDNASMTALMESVGCIKEGELKDVSYEAGKYRSYLLYRFMRED